MHDPNTICPRHTDGGGGAAEVSEETKSKKTIILSVGGGGGGVTRVSEWILLKKIQIRILFWVGGRRARFSVFCFYKESKSKIICFGVGGWWAGRGSVARVSDFFFTNNPNLKKLFWGGGGRMAWVSDFFYKESKSKNKEKKIFSVLGGGGCGGKWLFLQRIQIYTFLGGWGWKG